MLRRAKIRVEAHLSYYAIMDNGQACSTFVYSRYAHPAQSAQPHEPAQGAYNWDHYNRALAAVGWPRARVLKDLNPCRRAEAC
jgi:hypothetical protein